MRILVWFVYFDDQLIDEQDLREIQVLITQLQCKVGVRQNVRTCLEAPEDVAADTEIARKLEIQNADSSEAQLALKYSLMKDAIRLRRTTSKESALDTAVVRQLACLLSLEHN